MIQSHPSLEPLLTNVSNAYYTAGALTIGAIILQAVTKSSKSVAVCSIHCDYHTCVNKHTSVTLPGRVAQSVTCLATDACLTADSGVASSIPARSHTFVEIDHEIISTVILLPSADSFKKGCCQLQAKVCAQTTG